MKRVEIRIFLLAILVILTSYVPDSEMKKKVFFFQLMKYQLQEIKFYQKI